MTPPEVERPNPYEPPQSAAGRDPRDLPRLPEERFGEVDVRLVGAETRSLQRRFILENTADGDVLYDAWGSWLIGECIYVNGRLRTRHLGIGFGWEYVAWVAPRIEFLLEWQGTAVPARLEVALGMNLFFGLRFKHVRLFVAEKCLYDEAAGIIRRGAST